MSLAAMPCSACCGSGQRKGENEHEWETFMETCEACKGSGTLEIEDCPNAERIHGGAGQSKQPETPTPLDDAACYASFELPETDENT